MRSGIGLISFKVIGIQVLFCACMAFAGCGLQIKFHKQVRTEAVNDSGGDPALVAHYDFNGSLSDSSIYALPDATLSGAALSSMEGSNGALCFPGNSSHYANLGDSPNTRMKGDEPKSFSVWFKVTDFALSTVPNLLRYDDRDIQDGDNPNARVLYIVRVSSSRAIYFYAGSTAQGLVAAASGGSQFTVGQWAHLAWVRDPDAQMIYGYLNGTLLVSQVDSTAGQTWETTGQSLLLGRMNDGQGNTETFKGCLDELRIYSKALDGADVTGIFESERAGFGI